MYKLFKFQQKAVDDCLSFFKGDLKNGIVIVPTAGGKSIIIGKIVENLSNCLIVVPSIELLEQNLRVLNSLGLSVSIYSASFNSKEISNITIATMDSLKNKGGLFKENQITNVIVDEAHFKTTTEKDGTFKTFIKDLKPKKLLGLTATPFKLDSLNSQPAIRSLHRMRESLFKNIIHITQVSEVIAENRWSKIIYDIHPVDKTSLKLNSSKTDYSDESIELFLKQNNINNRVCSLLRKYESKKTLTFVESVDVAKKIKEWFNTRGFSSVCEVISGDMNSKDRKQAITSYLDPNSNVKHLINYGTLTTGFDDPLISVLINARPTMSLALYYQILGRLTRVHPDKKEGLYIDLVGNYNNFGKVESFNFDYINGQNLYLFAGERLLTDISLICPVDITKDMLRNPPRLRLIGKRDVKLTFGKYKDKFVSRVPAFYRDYIYDNILPPYSKEQLELRAVIEDLRYNDSIKPIQKKKAS